MLHVAAQYSATVRPRVQGLELSADVMGHYRRAIAGEPFSIVNENSQGKGVLWVRVIRGLTVFGSQGRTGLSPGLARRTRANRKYDQPRSPPRLTHRTPTNNSQALYHKTGANLRERAEVDLLNQGDLTNNLAPHSATRRAGLACSPRKTTRACERREKRR